MSGMPWLGQWIDARLRRIIALSTLGVYGLNLLFDIPLDSSVAFLNPEFQIVQGFRIGWIFLIGVILSFDFTRKGAFLLGRT